MAGGVNLAGASQPFKPDYQDPMVESWRWHTFAELSGLGAQCLTEGPGGAMWFGTTDGVWSYDGIDWHAHVEHEVIPGTVVSLCTGTDGAVYVGRRTSINQYSHGQWRQAYSAPPHMELRKLAAARDGSIWAATSCGLLHGQQSRWTFYTSADQAARWRTNGSVATLSLEVIPAVVLAKSHGAEASASLLNFMEVCEDGQGKIWAGNENGEVFRYDPSLAKTSPQATAGWRLYNEEDGMICGKKPCILPLRSGSVWVAYASACEYLNEFDGTTWQAFDLADFGLPSDCVHLVQTRDGVIWLSSNAELAACREGVWQTYRNPGQPIPNARNFVFESTDGALWIGGPNTEIERMDYETSRWFTLLNLNFQWESPAGAQWFLHRDGRVIRHDANGWTSYGPEDGLMDAPVLLLGAKNGEVWAAGSHEHTAATARFDGRSWTRFVHADFSWGVDYRAALAASDGSVWFGAAVDSSGPANHSAGILQFRNGQWIHHHQPGRAAPEDAGTNPATRLPATQRPEPVGKFFNLGESRDGKIWAGHMLLAFNDGQKWEEVPQWSGARIAPIETMFTSRDRDLWVGTMQLGVLCYDGHGWQRFQGKDGLVANTARSITQTADGSLWVATERGVSCFDGSTWTANLLPRALDIPEEGGSLKAGPAGQIWINRYTLSWNTRAWPRNSTPYAANSDREFWTVCHPLGGPTPHTSITTTEQVVSPPGNLTIFWSGLAAWRDPEDTKLQFSFRLDDQPWSPYTDDGGHSFFTLPSGAHHFAVRARDRDFNVDPVPATLDFRVLPPVWRQLWFLLLMAAMAGLIVAQSFRVVRERNLLRKARSELEDRVCQRTAQLEAANRELEAFSYSVSHDLRAPLRSIDGFSRALLEDYEDKLEGEGKDYLQLVRAASQRMGQLIDDLLMLARVTRAEIRRTPVDLSGLAGRVAGGLQTAEPGRQVVFHIEPGLVAEADGRLVQIVLENLMGNAWKFTGKEAAARIEFGQTTGEGGAIYYVRDNGAGFDMTYVQKLFGAFQRLHTVEEFPGTGIGLATVQRIIRRHGGRVWGESVPGRQTTFYFTLPSEDRHS
jgi:signal transduction histidine kinase/ligand-binding sensor domain-containing protein